jgi:hypothetical protein
MNERVSIPASNSASYKRVDKVKYRKIYFSIAALPGQYK